MNEDEISNKINEKGQTGRQKQTTHKHKGQQHKGREEEGGEGRRLELVRHIEVFFINLLC